MFRFDCGVFALTLANGWEARVVPKFTAEDIPSIRKQLTNAWVDNANNKAPWKSILKLAYVNFFSPHHVNACLVFSAPF